MPRLPEAAARRLLGSARVARLASITGQGRPHLVPVTFALDGDRIYSAIDAKPKTTRRLQRLGNIRPDRRDAGLPDRYDHAADGGGWAAPPARRRSWWTVRAGRPGPAGYRPAPRSTLASRRPARSSSSP